MKKLISLIAVLSILILPACQPSSDQQNNQGQPVTPTTKQEVEVPETDESTTDTESETPSELSEHDIPELNIKIALPTDYEVSLSSEVNRRGSFATYFFETEQAYPSLQEIQFFSEESIQNFTANCGENNPCFMGDYPTVERYQNQKQFFEQGTSHQDYELKTFNDRSYFASTHRCVGDSCLIREYTTFINDTKVDIWIFMESEDQITAADQLFQNFRIIQ